MPMLQRALPICGTTTCWGAWEQPVWRWPQWQPRGPLSLARACDLCAVPVARCRPSEVYLVWVTRWRVCARRHRWLDNLREAGTAGSRWPCPPEVAHAHQQRLGWSGGSPGGPVVFADALYLAAFWWKAPALSPSVWAARRDLLPGPVGSDLRIVPLVGYPETVHVAAVLAARERRWLRSTCDARAERERGELLGGLLEEGRGMSVAPALLPSCSGRGGTAAHRWPGKRYARPGAAAARPSPTGTFSLVRLWRN
ncbi:hypothetical protein [Streptomyces sp. NPDC047046]|uniref:hypothetical protein n=1 Tax=Streptomyces sp. NPDC047046 TaxID=3155378 RepID=UPI0033C23F71